MSRVAITGAGGFVGRHVASAASARGLDVVGVVRSEKAAETVRRAGARPAFVSGLEEGALAAALEGAAAVVHLAQIGSEREGASYDGVNVAGTRAVAAAAARAGVGRAVFLSGLGVARFGQSRRCTSRYFLSKLAAEVELYRSSLDVAVFRPSYIVGPGNPFLQSLLAELGAGEVEVVGDGGYRLQPVAVRDAAEAVLETALDGGPSRWRVFDLVGPEAVSYRALLDRLAARSGTGGFRVRTVPVEEADRQAAAEGGYRGMGAAELDCLLCDEVSDSRPLEALLGRLLTPLDQVLDEAVRGSLAAGGRAQ